MKRTRNIITTHMKSVHVLSWSQYKDRTQYGVKREAGDCDMDPLSELGSPPRLMDVMELFECVLCDSRIKGRKQHLTK